MFKLKRDNKFIGSIDDNSVGTYTNHFTWHDNMILTKGTNEIWLSTYDDVYVMIESFENYRSTL